MKMKMKMKNNNSITQLKLIQEDTFLTQKEKDIIVGTILGDGHIYSNKISLVNNKFQLNYGYANKTYAEFVFEGLKRLITKTEPSVSKSLDSRYNNKERIAYRFTTKILESLIPFGRLFLEPYFSNIKNKYYYLKVLPDLETLYELITPRALAY
jgi:hypothetical protein